jgi:O-antigen ligase
MNITSKFKYASWNRVAWSKYLAEGIIVGMACVAPWMFGAVDACAEFVLALGAGLVATLAALSGRTSSRWRDAADPTGLCLAGMVVLALVQAVPLPGRLHAILDPSAAASRATLLPGVPERVVGDPGSPVGLAPATLSQDPGATYDAAARLAAAWLLFRGVLGLGGGYAALRRFGWAVGVNAALLALFSLIQSLTWNGKIYWLYPSPHADAWSGGGPFVCHSHQAEYLNLGLGFALGLLLGGGRGTRPGGRSDHLWATYVVGVLVLGILTSHSRGGFLAMLASAALTVLVLRVSKAMLWVGLAAALALTALFLLALGDASPYARRLGTIGNSVSGGYAIRAEVWHDALGAWWAHPLWGTGLGTFGFAAGPYFQNDRNKYFAHAENEYVEMLVEGGVVGLGLALAGLVGIAQRARRALRNAPSASERALILGVCSGVAAVLLQCVGDFGLHVPGVSVPLVIFCAHLCHLGSRSPSAPVPVVRISRRRRVCGAIATASLSALVAYHGFRQARTESLIAAAGLPPPNSEMPTPAPSNLGREELLQARTALERAVRLCPGWTEGHLRLGLTEVALYRSTAADWLADSVPDPAERARLADPLWLLAAVREGEGDPAGLLEHEPIRRHLIPAARSFLEARRCCPVSALAHAELGALAYMLDSNAPASLHVRRALRTAGADSGVLMFAARVAYGAGDPRLAALCWRRTLQVGGANWTRVADAAGVGLSPDQVLEWVVPADRGRFGLWFADRLYASPQDSRHRARFLRMAAERLPDDRGLPEAERLRLEAEAWAGLGRREHACDRMEAALVLEPGRFEWRKQLIDWLLAGGKSEEARGHALIGLHLHH